MSIFTKLKELKERRRIKSTFEKFVSKDVAKKILNGDISDAELLEMKYVDVDFILIKVDDSHFESVPKQITNISNFLLDQENVFIDNLFSSFIYILIVNNELSDNTPLPDRRKELVYKLLKLFGNSISIIHGRRECLAGNLGNSRYMQYNYVLPGITSIMKSIIGLSIGKECEI